MSFLRVTNEIIKGRLITPLKTTVVEKKQKKQPFGSPYDELKICYPKHSLASFLVSPNYLITIL